MVSVLLLLTCTGAASVPAVQGAQATNNTRPPIPPAPVPARPPAPLRYFIGHEVVVVDVTATARTAKKVEVVTGDDIERCIRKHKDAQTELCLTERTVTTREGTVGTKLVPSPTLSADVSIAAKALTDDTLSVELRDGMLLKAINVKSTGRAGDLVVSIAKLAGAFVGAVGLAATETPASVVPTSTCDAFTKPFEDLPETVRLWIWENQTKCDEWKTIAALQRALDRYVADRLAIEHEIRGATGPALTLLLDKLKALDEATKKAQNDLAPRQKTFNTQLEAYIASLHLGVTTTTRTHSQVLQLSDLPESSVVQVGQPSGDVDQIATQFKPAAESLWAQSKVVVTFDPSVPLECDPAPFVPNGGAALSGKTVNIFFRQGAPARMRVFIADQADGAREATLRSMGDRFDNFVHPCLAVSAMTFKRSSWAEREISLTFDEKGRPIKLDRTSKSDAAAVASSMAAAATTFRDTLTETVKKTAEFQADRRRIALNDLTMQLERLKAQKEAMDAQVALDAAGLNVEASLRQKQAAADLEAIKAEISLATAKDSVEQKKEIEALKVSVDLVQQQLDLLKAQMELDKLKP